MDGKIDNKQFGRISGTSTTDVLLEMVNNWYESTDTLDSYVRVVMLYFSNAFDLLNHFLLLDTLQLYDLPEHTYQMDGGLLIGQKPTSIHWKSLLTIRSPQWRSTEGTLSGPKCFLGYIDHLEYLFIYINTWTTVLYLK